MTNEELQEKFEQLESSIDWIKINLIELLDEKGLAPVKTPYEVEVPEDVDDCVYINNIGNIYNLNTLTIVEYEKIYKRGLAFRIKEEAEKYDKERILLFKLHKWAEEQNDGWTPNWKDCNETKYFIIYDKLYETFKIDCYARIKPLSKLPYFKSEEITKQFIEEFGKEIKEVLL